MDKSTHEVLLIPCPLKEKLFVLFLFFWQTIQVLYIFD